MRTPDQVRWDFVQEWLDRGRHNLEAAHLLLGAPVGDLVLVGFHAQQTAEMFLKAVLVRHQIEFPKTHDLVRLLQLADVEAPGMAQPLVELDELTPYAVETRYPGTPRIVTEQDAARAIELAERARDLVLDHLRPYLETGRPGASSG